MNEESIVFNRSYVHCVLDFVVISLMYVSMSVCLSVCVCVCVSVTTFPGYLSLSKGLNLQKLDNILLRGSNTAH